MSDALTPEELRRQIKFLPLEKMPEFVKGCLSDKKERAVFLSLLDDMLKGSKLTEEDCLRLGEEIKEEMLKRYKEEGW